MVKHGQSVLVLTVLMVMASGSDIGCCTRLIVFQGDYHDRGAQREVPQIFTSYAIEPDKINGRVHYTSKDGKYALAYNEKTFLWMIQTVQHR